MYHTVQFLNVSIFFLSFFFFLFLLGGRSTTLDGVGFKYFFLNAEHANMSMGFNKILSCLRLWFKTTLKKKKPLTSHLYFILTFKLLLLISNETKSSSKFIMAATCLEKNILHVCSSFKHLSL